MQGMLAVPPSRRARLKQVTEAPHLTLDTKISQDGWLTTSAGYNAYLEATLQARRSIEAELDAANAMVVYPIWNVRKLTQSIADDLADLGLISPPVAQGAPGSILSEGGVWGALYVLEGSALGARVLQRRAEALGMTAQHGARHLAHQVSDNGACKTFLAILEAAPLDATEEAAGLLAARRTFEQFDRAYTFKSAVV